jgi:hypothetical protein
MSAPRTNLLVEVVGQNIAGSDGDVIASFVETSDNGFTCSQGTSGKRPTLKEGGVKDRKYIKFDGIDDAMLVAGIAQSSVRVIAAVVSYASGGGLCDVGGFHRFVNVGGIVSAYAGTTLNGPATPVDGSPFIVIVQFLGASGKISVDDDEVVGDIGSHNDGSPDNLIFGSGNGGASNFGDLAVYEFLVYSDVPDIEAVKTYLQNTYFSMPAPTCTNATISSDGVTLSLTFDQAVTGVHAADYHLTGRTLSAASGSGTDWTMTIAPAVYVDDVRTLSYDGDGTVNDEDTALAAFSGMAVTNNSEEEPPAPSGNAGFFGGLALGLGLGLCFGAVVPGGEAEPTAPVNTEAPVVSGPNTPPLVGDVLECTAGTWTGDPTAYSYQWFKGNEPPVEIDGATSSTLDTTSLLGEYISCRVIATNAVEDSEPVFSNMTAPVTVGPPINIDAPIVSPTEGSVPSSTVFSCGGGNWTFEPVTYEFQWYNTTGILPGRNTFQLEAVSVGSGSYYCVVTATNDAGSGEAQSNTITITE